MLIKVFIFLFPSKGKITIRKYGLNKIATAKNIPAIKGFDFLVKSKAIQIMSNNKVFTFPINKSLFIKVTDSKKTMSNNLLVKMLFLYNNVFFFSKKKPKNQIVISDSVRTNNIL